MQFTFFLIMVIFSLLFLLQDKHLKFHIQNKHITYNLQIKEKFFTVPYVKSISESFSPISNMFHYKLAFFITNTLKSFIKRGKDKLELLSNQNMIHFM